MASRRRNFGMPILCFGFLLLLLGTSYFVGEAEASACRSTDGSSQDCFCSKTTVNCGFLGSSKVDVTVPRTTTELYLYNNLITDVALSSFSGMTALKKLDLRNNRLTTIRDRLYLTDLTSLEELYLPGNLITSLPEDVFVPLVKLRILDLSRNLITSLGGNIFANKTFLTEIRLQQNVLKDLPVNMFRMLKALTILYLHNNNVTAVDVNLFKNMTSLTTLSLQNNNIRWIPKTFFSGMPLLQTFSMMGNPSGCMLSGGVMDCVCFLGFTGDGSSCEPRDCGPAITDLDEHASATCSGDTRYLGTPCIASCNTGYLGGASAYTCNTAGVWIGNLTCTPIDCGKTITSLNGKPAHYTCGGDTRFTGTPCIATCDSGYDGGSLNYTCNAAGVWTGALTCSRKNCGTSIQGLDTHASSSCSNTLFEDMCTATCKTGYVGGPANYTCGPDGRWFGALSCAGRECGRKIQALDENANARCRGDTSFNGTECVAKCNDGYVGGPSSYRCAADGTWQPKTSAIQCQRRDCGPTIKGLTAAAQAMCNDSSIQGYGMTLYQSPCRASCVTGYDGNATDYVCNADGLWEGSINCTVHDCGEAIEYLDPNATPVFNGTLYSNVSTATCNKGYVDIGNEKQRYFYCLEDGWVGRKSFCVVDCGTFIPAYGEGALNATCNSTRLGDNCTMECGHGYHGSAQFVCRADSEWFGSLSCVADPLAMMFYSSGKPGKSGLNDLIAMVLIFIATAFIIFLIFRSSENKKRTKQRVKIETPRTVGSMKQKSKPEDGGMIQNPMYSFPTVASLQESTTDSLPRNRKGPQPQQGGPAVVANGWMIPVSE